MITCSKHLIAAPKLKDLLKELCSKVAHKWENIGVMLEIEEGLLSKVKEDNKGDSSGCLREMFKIWLKKTDPPPAWLAVINALEDLGEHQLAESLSKKYSKT